MRHWIASLLLTGCAGTSASPSAAPPPPTSRAPSSSVTEPAPAPAPAQAVATAPVAAPPVPSGAREHSMRNCPTAVAGATTQLTKTGVGVDLEITTSDPAARRQVITLARMHSHLGDPDGVTKAHTGRHGGPGVIGHCPIVHASTNVTFTPTPNGVVIHINAIVPEDVPAVQVTVADRLARLAQR
ncbi:MAG TPA: hypothetical protein VFT22_28460 [Kofleriaceae bacterium]|nr:hypothetical protein [Kofleriaceae bacterium]